MRSPRVITILKYSDMDILAIIFGVLMFVWMGAAVHFMQEVVKRNERIEELERDIKRLQENDG